ncbi:M23 family metallopeptidase [Amycolatopsis sp. DG1A-15b]|uniref:M23 family metallopeptidase n=1 Tax=Amycolatopsis sp. DG1A-15b TaxID=3052846 RepID=UPI00255BB0E2|nr:M23 family metallopeptidase [Amycolatopsis sp. DG1A-15b]WIX89716.1 M23 family metallopeptidase [Amycolatopsis sp. DG1A-15b]
MNLSVRAASLAAAVVSAVGLLAPPASAEAFPPLALPFEAGQQVYSAGIHSDDGGTGVRNAIDFSPADGTVRASLAGTVHLQHCAGGDWVTIDHPGGRRTGYYHLEGIRVTEGEQVEAGTVLGSTGNALPCGGSSTGAHVHFTLWTLPNAAAGDWDGVAFARISTTLATALGEPINGKTLGGWRFTEGAEQYSGTATHLADEAVIQLPGRFRASP